MKTQLELGLPNKKNNRSGRAKRRMPTARWWFERMHDVVNQAFDWTHPAARPQQICFELKPASGSQTRRGIARDVVTRREWVA